MGKAAKEFTPSFLEVETISFPIPLELSAEIRARLAEQNQQRKTIDRVLAIRDGLIKPPWVKEPEPEFEPIRSSTNTEWPIDRVEQAIRVAYPGGVGKASTAAVNSETCYRDGS